MHEDAESHRVAAPDLLDDDGGGRMAFRRSQHARIGGGVPSGEAAREPQLVQGGGGVAAHQRAPPRLLARDLDGG